MKARLVAIVVALACAAGAATAHVRHLAAPGTAARVVASQLDPINNTQGGWYDQERNDPTGVNQ